MVEGIISRKYTIPHTHKRRNEDNTEGYGNNSIGEMIP
jgi:hypothetical protein